MTTLSAYLDGQLCGTVEQSRTGDLRFTYDENYRTSPDATPLSLSMPLTFPDHRKRAILPFLEGLITDNEVARQALATRYGVGPGSAARDELVDTDTDTRKFADDVVRAVSRLPLVSPAG